METKSTYYFVAADCAPGLEEKFNRWQDEVHIPLLLKFPKLKSVSRYKLTRPVGDIPSRFKPAENWPKYLSVYEFGDLQAVTEYLTSSELEAAAQEMRQSWKEGEIEVKWRAHYQLINTFDNKPKR